MTPEEFEAFLDGSSEEGFRGFTVGILNTPLPVRGVRTPAMRREAKEICRGDWRSFLTWDTRSFEQCFVKGLVIATAKMPQSERLNLSDAFLPEIRDWAVCDAFCGSWHIDRRCEEDLWSWSAGLLGAGEEFAMRVGAVMMSHFIDDAHIDRMLDLLSAPRESPGYYWEMGCAWALSSCYVRYPDRTEEALFEGGLSPVILKMAAGKIRDSFRVPDERKNALKARLREIAARSRRSRP